MAYTIRKISKETAKKISRSDCEFCQENISKSKGFVWWVGTPMLEVFSTKKEAEFAVSRMRS